MRSLQDLINSTAILHYKEIDLGLDRCLNLLEKLDNPHLKIPPVFHVSGTNGKGSTLAFVKQILEDNHYRVHRYTSPHLVHFNERIELCGKPADETLLAGELAEILRINDGLPITTFEIITCLAFVLFSKIPADFTLLEVGVGGRLDATNVIQQPLITAITSIGYDHQDFLGSTLGLIAFEKAGIIKPQVPVVTPSNIDPDALSVIDAVAKQNKAPLVLAESVTRDVGLYGTHQRYNAAVAVKMIECAGIKCVDIESSLKKTRWSGRLEKIEMNSHEIWLDGAHNQAGAKALAETLTFINPDLWTFFIHIKARKDAEAMLVELAPIAGAFYFINLPIEGGEAMSINELMLIANKFAIPAFVIETLPDLKRVVTQTSEPKIMTGSLFWVGYVLSNLTN